MAATGVPAPRHVDCTGDVAENFATFKEVFSDYSIATGLDKKTEPVQVATLRSLLGDACRKVLKTLNLSVETASTTDGILDALTNHFTPRRNTLYPRFLFRTATQQVSETVEQFYIRLQTLVKACKYKDLLTETELVTDQLVLGSRDKLTRAELFRAAESPTLTETLEALRVSESAQTELKHVESEYPQTSSEAVNYVRSRSQSLSKSRYQEAPARRHSSSSRGGGKTNFSNFRNNTGNPRNGRPYSSAAVNFSCQYCGKQHVKDGQCPAYGQRCNFCSRLHHFESVCWKKGQQSVNFHEEYEPRQNVDSWSNQETLNYVQEPVLSGQHQLTSTKHRGLQEDDDPFFSEDLFHIEEISLDADRLPDSKVEEIHAIQTQGARTKLFSCLYIHEANQQPQPLRCQLDTGATCNVMNIKDFKNIQRTSSVFTSVSMQGLTLYDNSVMRLVGETALICSVGNEKQKLTFKIIEGPHKPPLLSAKTCVELGLITVHDVSHVDHDLLELGHMKQARESAKEILDTYSDVFVGLGEFPGVHTIEVDKSVPPVQHLPRRVPVALLSPLKEKLDELEKRGIVKKVTQPTDWISSLVIVQKNQKINAPQGHIKKSLRICIDPKDLNKAIKRAKYPMPILDDILPSLTDAKIFSVLDAKDGFYQIRLSEESSFLTTFWTPFGRYRYLRMPFGISSAPEEFQRQILELLEGLQGVYDVHDDILVVGRGSTIADAITDHNMNLKALLNRARERKLKLNKEKVRLALTEVTYMGHRVTNKGIKPDPAKIQAILEMVPPEDKKALQRFLGSINYVSRFLPAMSTISEPLRKLLEKDVIFTWQSSQESAFRQLKKMLTEAPVLAYYDHRKEVTIQCDASESGLGAVLLQEGHPVAYASKALTSSEINYAQIEKECLGIVFACGRFEHYIGGRKQVLVETDHKPLIPIFTKPLRCAPKRLQRMLLQLQSHTLHVQYKPGPTLHIADMLSRSFLPHSGPSQLQNLHVYHMEEENFEDIASVDPSRYLPVSSVTVEEIRVMTRKDGDLQKLRQVILKGWPQAQKDLPVELRGFWHTKDEYTTDQELVYKGQRLLIPAAIRKKILEKLHYSHMGAAATIRKARETVYWPGIEKEIQNYIDGCQSCQTFLTKQYREPLKPFEIPTLPWQMVAQDIFTLNDINYLVTVDYYSGFWELDVLRNMTAPTLITCTKAHFARHGIPQVLVTDNGTNFVGREYADFSVKWGFLHVTTSPYHSRANGKAESTVKIVKNLLKKVEFAKQDVALAILEWRNTPQKDGTTAVQKLYSRQTKSLLPLAPENLRPAVIRNVPDIIATRQMKMKKWYDKGTRELPSLEKGQKVKIDPRRRHAPWVAATCESVVGPRSYLLRTDQGSLLRRNRHDIRVEKSLGQMTLPQYKDTVSKVRQIQNRWSVNNEVPSRSVIQHNDTPEDVRNTELASAQASEPKDVSGESEVRVEDPQRKRTINIHSNQCSLEMQRKDLNEKNLSRLRPRDKIKGPQIFQGGF